MNHAATADIITVIYDLNNENVSRRSKAWHFSPVFTCWSNWCPTSLWWPLRATRPGWFWLSSYATLIRDLPLSARSLRGKKKENFTLIAEPLELKYQIKSRFAVAWPSSLSLLAHEIFSFSSEFDNGDHHYPLEYPAGIRMAGQKTKQVVSGQDFPVSARRWSRQFPCKLADRRINLRPVFSWAINFIKSLK